MLSRMSHLNIIPMVSLIDIVYGYINIYCIILQMWKWLGHPFVPILRYKFWSNWLGMSYKNRLSTRKDHGIIVNTTSDGFLNPVPIKA